MVDIYSFVKRSFFLFLFTVMASYTMAAPTISLTVTPGSCPASGSIVVNATGTSGTVFYAIRKTSDASFSPQQASNSFSNLETGNYIIAVYDDTGTTQSNTTSLTNAAYTSISISKNVSGNTVVTGCNDDGSIEIGIAGGRGPFTYKLKDGPTTKPDLVIAAQSPTAKFTQLSTGIYSIDITDACGNTYTVPDISVTSLYNISSYKLGSFDLQAAILATTTGCDLKITFPSNNARLVADDGTVLFWRTPTPSKFIPSGYPLLMKIEYPAGSGQYLSDWHTIAPSVADVIPTYSPTSSDPKSNKFRILVKHPCNASDTVFSQEYTFADPFVSRNGACSPIIDRNIPDFNCGSVTIVLTNKTSPSNTRSYTWNDNNSSYLPDVSGLPAGKYSVSITTSGGFTFLSNDVDVGSLPAINTAFIYNYVSTLGCDFTTGGFRVYGIAVNDTTTKTYSIASGPVTRTPISGASNMNLWTDLPEGTYVLKIQYGDCGSTTRTLNLKMPYNGFGSDELSYIPGPACGQYHITGKAWYLAPDNTPSNTGTYAANVFKSDGTFLSYSTGTSNGLFTSVALSPGTYRISFQSSSHSQNICYYTQADKYITIPPYIPIGIDISKSGGVVCSDGKGILHIDTIGGSGKGISYRIKPKGTPDSGYTNYQPSPDFSNTTAGNYTAQVMDSCGYTYTQDVTMVAAAVAATIEVTGADTIGEVAYVCPGNNVIVKLKVTGEEPTSIKWEKPDGSEVYTKEDTIYNFSSIDEGKYAVIYTSNGCVWEDSIVIKLNSKPEFAYADPSLISPSVTGDSISIIVGIVNQGDAATGSPVYVSIYKETLSAANYIMTDSANIQINPGGMGYVTVKIADITPYLPMVNMIVRVNDRNGVFPYQPECDETNNVITILNPAINLMMKKDATLEGIPHNGTYQNPVAALFNETIEYTITAVNANTGIGKVIIRDTLPPYLDFVSSNPVVVPTVAGSAPQRSALEWAIAGVASMATTTVTVKATPQEGSSFSQPMFINRAWVTVSDTINVPTNATYHQGASVGMATFSAGFGGNIYNAAEQALDYKTTPRAGIVIVSDEGYRFAGWSHEEYVSLRGKTIPAEEGIMYYDTLTVYGDIELKANFELEKYPIEYHLNGSINTGNNPPTYTIKSGSITLEAPEKAEDVFIGWTGSNGEALQQTVIIPTGSTGELEFYANFLRSGREDKSQQRNLEEDKVWAAKDELYIRTSKPGSVVRIYFTEGILQKEQTILQTGEIKIKLLRGIYIVTLNNSIGQKIIIE